MPKAFGGVLEADSAYNAGDYQAAINYYEQVQQEMGESAPLLYNLGNSYYMANDYAKAVLCYERAYRLDPSSKMITRNLDYLRNKVEDANRAEQKGKKVSVMEDEPTFFQNIHNAIAVEIASDRWAVWGVVAFFVFLALAGIYIFTSNVLFRKIGFFGGFIFLGLTVICIIFGFLSASAFYQRESGILTSYKTSLATEPLESTQNDGTVLTRGTKVRVISEEINAEGEVTWYKIRLNSDYIGWVKAEDLEII